VLKLEKLGEVVPDYYQIKDMRNTSSLRVLNVVEFAEHRTLQPLKCDNESSSLPPESPSTSH
jgi:hypothetical protein